MIVQNINISCPLIGVYECGSLNVWKIRSRYCVYLWNSYTRRCNITVHSAVDVGKWIYCGKDKVRRELMRKKRAVGFTANGIVILDFHMSFSRRYIFRLCSFEVWHHAVWSIGSKVLEESASIFRVYSEDGGKWFIRNVGTFTSVLRIWLQQAFTKCWYLSTELHGVTS